MPAPNIPPHIVPTCDLCVGSRNGILSGARSYRGRITFEPAETGNDDTGSWATCPKCDTRFYLRLRTL